MNINRFFHTAPIAAVASGCALMSGAAFSQPLPEKPVGATTTQQAPTAGTSRGATSDWFNFREDDLELEAYVERLDRDVLVDREQYNDRPRFDYEPSERLNRQAANQRALREQTPIDRDARNRAVQNQQRSVQERPLDDLPSNQALENEYAEELEDAGMLLDEEYILWDEERYGTDYGVTGPEPHDIYRQSPDTRRQYDEKYPQNEEAAQSADQERQEQYDDPFGDKIPMLTNEPEQAERVIKSERQQERHVIVTPGEVGVAPDEDQTQQRPQQQRQAQQQQQGELQQDVPQRQTARQAQPPGQPLSRRQIDQEEGVERAQQPPLRTNPREQQMNQENRPLYTQNTTAPGLVDQQQRERAAQQRVDADAAQQRAYWAGVQRGQAAGVPPGAAGVYDEDVDLDDDGSLAIVGGRVYTDAEAVVGGNVYTDDWYDPTAPFYNWYAY